MLSVVTDAKFEQVLCDNNTVIVLFVAPWVKACQFIRPAYKFLSNNNRSKGLFVAVDVNLCPNASIDVDDLPTFHIYQKGSLVDTYTGTDGHELLSFINSI
jgi:thiol-disulfide isomerase/thioredoxin